MKRLGLDNGPVASRTRSKTKKGGASKKRNYNNNKNFWENVPRKVVDKVCEPKDNEDCITTPNFLL